MTTIRLHKHACEAVPPQHFQSESIGLWLLQHYGKHPPHELHVYAGEPSAETDVTGDAQALARNDAPLYVVLEAPGEPVITTVLINLAISTAISLAARFLTSSNTKPLDNRTQESPNNALSARENQLRPLQRVEDIFGTVRAIPSLMMQTYTKYVDHRQVEYSLLCVGRGYYDITDVRDGDTDLSQITGASAAIYAPFNSPNFGVRQALIGDPIVDPVLDVSRSIAVEGTVLKAANQLQITPGLTYFFRGPGAADGELPATALDMIYQPAASRRPNFAAVAENGQDVTVTMANTGQIRTTVATVVGATKTFHGPAGFFLGVVDGTSVTVTSSALVVGNTGTFTVVAHTNSSLTVAEALTDDGGTADFSLQINYSGTRTIASVENGYVTLSGGPLFSSEAATFVADLVVDNGLSDWTDWATLPQTDRREVWTNVLARQGMFKDDGSKSDTSVAYEVQIEQLTALLVPTGVVETVTGGISGATSTERAETLERVTAWTGPARVRARRTTPFDYGFPGLVQDEITWMDLYAVAPVTKPHFGNKTTIHTVTRSTPGATSLRRRQLNCLASRLLPTYNGVTFSGAFDATGALTSGTIHATSKIVDIIAAVTVDPKIGAREIADIDLAQIWATQQSLDAWHLQCGQFNYTFDSDSLSYEDTINAIADAAFCRAYRQNGQIRLALDRPQANAVALFTHRNKKPRSETITRRFASDSDYDGVELVYVDPETETQETIRLPLDGSFTKLKRVEVSGIRSYEQAWFRANREYYTLRYQRMSIETVCTADARALLPNSRIEVVDNTRFRSWDGEVIAQDGLTLTLSRRVEFVPAVPHSIVLTKRDGSPQGIAVAEVAGERTKVLLSAPPAEAIVTEATPAVGVRTAFSFAADSARAAQAWLVRELSPPEDGYVRVTAVNYHAGYYTADALPVPAKDSVIN